MSRKPKILTVDDRPQNLYLLQRVLQKLDVEILEAASGAEALGLTLEHDFCVAIVDVQMPEMDGYELVELLRGNEKTATLPVIFVSAIYSDEYHHRRAYDAGAVDFMSKPFIPEILVNKVKVFIDLYNQRQNLQDLVDQLDNANKALSKRALQLETSSQLSRQITSILALEELLSQVVALIKERFSYSFVGIWLLDNERKHLVLNATSHSDGNLPVGYSLSLDEGKENQAAQSIIVHVCQTRELFLSNEVGCEAINLEAQAQKSTIAELALPLHVQQDLLGVLDIHSDRTAANVTEEAFAEDDIIALQVMADQIAVAIRNAGLYSQVVVFNEHLEDLVNHRTQELQLAYTSLERMDKNKTDFIAVAAHELRTPLTLIRGYAEMLREMGGLEAEFLPMLQGIINGEERLHEVVNNMLDITRIDSDILKLHKDLTSLRVIIRDICTNYGTSLKERNLKLTFENMESLSLIRADSELMYKLFGHLIVNAIKFTPDGGRIKIIGEMIDMDLPGHERERFAKVAIADSGIGIDPTNQELIFEKFYQTGEVQFHSTGKTKFKGGGPGLGLAISRGIVKAHAGRIWVESPGYDEQSLPGSTFYVLLPVSEEL
jgi:signal transduction histidine kinase/CheY-like chemotaxis protein